MTETVAFPGLGLSFEISRVAFSIGGYPIYWYGITFASGFLAGMLYFHLRARKLGIHPYDGLDVLLWAVIGGMIGARAYYVAFRWDMYKDDLIKIFAFREGGIAIYGGVIGSILAGWIAAKVKKAKFLPILDGGLTGLLLAQAVGRWGNFFNSEAFGCNTTLPWGMTSNTISRYLFNMADTLAERGILVEPTAPVHPTFFYEFVWNLAGFLLLAFVLTPRRKYDGQVSLGYMAWYGLGRFFIEGLRTDSLMLGSFRVSQLLALILFVGAAAAMAALHFRYRKNPAVLYVDTDASRERMAKVDAENGKAGTGGKAPEGTEPSRESGEPEESSSEGSEKPEESPTEDREKSKDPPTEDSDKSREPSQRDGEESHELSEQDGENQQESPDRDSENPEGPSDQNDEQPKEE